MKFNSLIMCFLTILIISACETENGDAPSNISEGFLGYVVKKEGDRALVVSPVAQDFGSRGGMANYHSAIWFNKAPANIKVGFEVEVWAKGGQYEDSYPAQATVEKMNVISAPTPKGATISESNAIQKALKSLELTENEFGIVKGAAYDSAVALWIVEVLIDPRKDVLLIRVKDQ